MKWEKVPNTPNVQIARGKFGYFTIKKYSGLYYAKYFGDKNFTLPPKRSIKELKELCQENYYWED